MIEVTEKEVERWRSAPETEMKWDEYPWAVGEKRYPVKVAFGAGLNSTAMLVGCFYQGRPVDKILFADTGGERPGTYRHKEEVSQWLQERGYPMVEDVYFTNGDGERITLFERCIDQGMLPSLAYGFQYKACSMKFKQTPQKQHMRQWEPAQRAWEQGGFVFDLVGFDVGETHRYADDKGKVEKYWVKYPLAKDWKWTRKDWLDDQIEDSDRPKWIHLLMRLACSTGMRLGELIQIKWERGPEDIGTGHARNYVYLDREEKTLTIKFKRKLRVIPARHVWGVFETLWKRRKDDRTHVFASPNGGHYDDSYVCRLWKKETEKAKQEGVLGRAYTCHSIRHAVVTSLLRKGYSAHKIGQLVGHSSEQITERYAHLVASDLDEMVIDLSD